MANEYAELTALKSALKITDTDRDALLSLALEAASRNVDNTTGRRFYLDTAATARVYGAAGRAAYTRSGVRLLIDDIGEANPTVELGSGVGGPWGAITDFEVWPEHALARGLVIDSFLRVTGWPLGSNRVRVTARWGWPAFPAEVIQATLIQANRLFHRYQSPEGLAGSDEWGLVRMNRVDPDVEAQITHLIQVGFG